MTFSVADHRFMVRAIRLAETGRYTTMPNPRVGCVIVQAGTVVGEGAHRYAGKAHAEILALAMAKDRARGATCYVTLQPCSHEGKTAPCTEALIKAGISRLVFALADPNPLVKASKQNAMTSAEITVEHGLLAKEARALNCGFFSRMERKRPWVRIKMAMSLDGKTAMNDGVSQWISGDAARADVQKLRAASCAIMVGAATVAQDNPQLTVRDAELVRQIKGQPLRVIVDRSLSTTANARVFTLTGTTLIYTNTDNPLKIRELEQAGATVIVQKHAPLLPFVMQHLATGEYEVNDLLVEGGGHLAGAIISEHLADELVLYMAPILMGSNTKGLFALPSITEITRALAVSITDVRKVGNDWRITALFER